MKPVIRSTLKLALISAVVSFSQGACSKSEKSPKPSAVMICKSEDLLTKERALFPHIRSVATEADCEAAADQFANQSEISEPTETGLDQFGSSCTLDAQQKTAQDATFRQTQAAYKDARLHYEDACGVEFDHRIKVSLEHIRVKENLDETVEELGRIRMRNLATDLTNNIDMANCVEEAVKTPSAGQFKARDLISACEVMLGFPSTIETREPLPSVVPQEKQKAIAKVSEGQHSPEDVEQEEIWKSKEESLQNEELKHDEVAILKRVPICWSSVSEIDDNSPLITYLRDTGGRATPEVCTWLKAGDHLLLNDVQSDRATVFASFVVGMPFMQVGYAPLPSDYGVYFKVIRKGKSSLE